jgi:hypothetical protein
MTAGGGDDDGAIRNGIEAAEHWPDFAQESMDSQFDAVRHIGDGAPMPPLVPEDSTWSVWNAIVTEAEQQSREIRRSLAARTIDDARWFGVQVPPDVRALAVKGEEED